MNNTNQNTKANTNTYWNWTWTRLLSQLNSTQHFYRLKIRLRPYELWSARQLSTIPLKRVKFNYSRFSFGSTEKKNTAKSLRTLCTQSIYNMKMSERVCVCECVFIVLWVLKSNHSRITAIKNRFRTQCSSESNIVFVMTKRAVVFSSLVEKKLNAIFQTIFFFLSFETNEFTSNYKPTKRAKNGNFE